METNKPMYWDDPDLGLIELLALDHLQHLQEHGGYPDPQRCDWCAAELAQEMEENS